MSQANVSNNQLKSLVIKVSLFNSLTLKTEEREVEFKDTWGSGYHYESEKIFVARIGKGDKVHGTAATLMVFDTPEEAKKFGWSKPDYVDQNGRVYFFRRDLSMRNRSAHIIGFASSFAGTGVETKQKYYGSVDA
jgi:hypothetical protein